MGKIGKISEKCICCNHPEYEEDEEVKDTQPVVFPICSTIKPLDNIQYDGNTYPRGICAVCCKSHFHSAEWILGTFICPLCEWNIKEAVKEGVMFFIDGDQHAIFSARLRLWFHSKGLMIE